MRQDPSGPADGYVLDRSQAETRRLIVQHQLYGPFTRQFLAAAGVAAGMRVLDVGSGAGDVALLPAELVGPQGRVLGVDTNAEVLEVARARVRAAGWTTVELQAGDALQLDPGEGCRSWSRRPGCGPTSSGSTPSRTACGPRWSPRTASSSSPPWSGPGPAPERGERAVRPARPGGWGRPPAGRVGAAARAWPAGRRRRPAPTRR
jgi:hypothetical protein